MILIVRIRSSTNSIYLSRKSIYTVQTYLYDQWVSKLTERNYDVIKVYHTSKHSTVGVWALAPRWPEGLARY